MADTGKMRRGSNESGIWRQAQRDLWARNDLIIIAVVHLQ